MGFSSLQSIVCRWVRGLSGSRGAALRRFRRRALVSSPAVPHHLRDGFILSCVLSSSEFLPALLRRSFQFGASCLGVCSLFATLPEVSTIRGAPKSRFVPSTGFLNLSTAYSTFGFAGLFHPAATSRVSVQGFGPAPQLHRLIAGHYLLALRDRRANRLPGCHATALRFEVLFRGSRRAPKSVFTLLRRRYPLRFFLLQVLATAFVRLPGLRSWPFRRVLREVDCLRSPPRARPDAGLQRVIYGRW